MAPNFQMKTAYAQLLTTSKPICQTTRCKPFIKARRVDRVFRSLHPADDLHVMLDGTFGEEIKNPTV